MRKIFILSLLISLTYFSCNNESEKEAITLNLNIKDKNLNHFFSKNSYFKIKGIIGKDSLNKYKFFYRNKFLNFESKNKFINNFKEGWLIDDSLFFNIHDLAKINSIPLKINFNNYKSKRTYLVPYFSIKNLELAKNRSSNFYLLDEGLKLKNTYSSNLEYIHPEHLDSIIFHKGTYENLNNLKSMRMYPENYDAFNIVHNPLTNYYTILPDFDKFSNIPNSIIDSLLNRIKFAKEKSAIEKEKIIIGGNFNIDETITYINKKIIILPNSKITLKKDAYLIFKNCSVEILGTKMYDIEFNGTINNSILFDNCKIVNISNSSFSNFSNHENDDLILPSAITFYNSDIEIKNSIFENNIKGDDLINFYNSNFNINNSIFRNSFADAIDSDFSNGVISNSLFENIGNDGIDCSGSIVKVVNTSIVNAKDKAISAGESTILKIYNSKILNSELAIVSKDGSKVYSGSNYLNNNRIDLSVFFKKDFYPPPFLEIDSINRSSLNLFQKNVKIKTKSNIKINYLEDVESLLYGNQYGKSSK